jgi:bacillithiol biosynthesis cysteine-adding enzyme BshC
MRDFFAEYVAESPQLLGFFANPPRALMSITPKTRQWDPTLVEAMHEYLTNAGGRPLFMGDEAAIVTGQQPGLLTGPLYTIYKAVAAILLARKAHERFGVRCVPVFWVASDDHDFDENRVASLFTRNHEILTLNYQPAADVAAMAMYRVPLEPSLHNLIDDAAAQASGSEFRDEIAAFLHESLDAAANLADWTAAILVRLFKNTPLIVFAPHMPAARKLAAPVFEREIRDPLVSTMLLNDCGRKLREMDFHQQVAKNDTECNFFLEFRGLRRKVLFNEDHYIIPDERQNFSIDEMAALLASEPERFSPNVALRCVVQQHLFPAAAYVAGPGEIAYWAQLKPLFRHFGEDMPIVYPRARCLLTDIKTRQIMEKFQFTFDDLAAQSNELAERALQLTSRAPAKEIVQRHRAQIETAFPPLVEELEPLNKSAADMVRSVQKNLADEFERIEAAIVKGEEAQAEAVRKQVQRVTTLLFPNRKPQERVFNVFSFLFEHGWDLVPRLLKEINVDSFQVKEIEL